MGDQDGSMKIDYSILSKKCDIYSFGLIILNLAVGGNHYGFVDCGQFNLFSRTKMDQSDIEALKVLHTESGNIMLQNHLCHLLKTQVIDDSLYRFLSRILSYDPEQRPSIDKVLDMVYLK